MVLDVATVSSNARIVRSTVASCVALEGGSIEDVEDARLLADELFSALATAGAERVRFDLDYGEGRVSLRVRAVLQATPPATSFEVLSMIAAVITPGYSLDVAADRASFDGAITAVRP